MRRLISYLISLSLVWGTASTVFGQGGVYVNGQTTSGSGNMSTNTYSTGAGAANSNTVDHALYADVAGNVSLPASNTWNNAAGWVASNGTPVANFSNRLSSTTFNDEGMRLLGVAGGYTLAELLADTYPRGASRDKPVFTYTMSPVADLNVTWNDGDVYDPEFGYYHLSSGSNALTDNAVNYAYWQRGNPQQILWTTGTRAGVSNSVNLGTFVCAFGRIIHAGETMAVGDMPLLMDQAHYGVMPSLIASGLNYASIGTNFNQIVQVGGVEYHNLAERNIHPAKVLTNYSLLTGSFLLTYAHTNVGAWGLAITNSLPVDKWDDGTNLIACTLSNWYRGVFLSAASSPSMGWVYPQAAYTSYVDCLNADDPQLPTGFDPYIPKCTAYIFQGGDTSLRTVSDSWVDRRFMIRRGTIATGGSSSGATPSLYQVLLQSADTGGILPYNMGNPSQPGQAANKAYVDSTINNINGNKVYVDAHSGNDGTALIQSSILPFKTIQAAIDAAALVASTTSHYTVVVSGGSYHENITMKNFVGVRADDIEGTIIQGTVTYPPAYTDTLGSELTLLSVVVTNTPAVIINAGADDAYAGIRSCYLSSTYDNGQSNKSVILIQRGLGEAYGTPYNELILSPTNGSGTSRNAQIFEHTSDPLNPGLSQFTAFNNSCSIMSSDTNDDVSVIYTHDNTDAKCINTLMGTVVNVHLDVTNDIYANNFKLVNHNQAQGRTLSKDTVVRLYMNYTNNHNVFFGYCSGGMTDNVAIIRGNHVRMPSGSTSNIWLGSATSVNDKLRVYDSVFIQNYADYPYPKIYTNAGSAGKFFINTVTENGDHLFGGALDLANINTTSPVTPDAGHVKFYVDNTSGFERPYFVDSRGNKGRICRDSVWTVYNAETNTLRQGELVKLAPGVTGAGTTYARRALGDSITNRAFAYVTAAGGIPAGDRGMVNRFGRLESGIDTSFCAQNDELYLSATTPGAITNVAPTGTNIAQFVGWCQLVGTNGSVVVQISYPDTLGGLPPSAYATINWASGSSNTVNAATIGGFTVDQLVAQQLTYYTWGSVSGTYPGSRLCQLASPETLPVRTNMYLGVTNNQTFSGLCISTNENPRALTKGVATIHSITTRTGDAGYRSLRARVTVYESDLTTVVTNFVASDIDSCPTNLAYHAIDVAITADVNIRDYGRVIVANTVADTGWTGTETLSLYSQNSTLSRVTLPGSASGVYVSHTESDAQLNWVTSNSNSVTAAVSTTSDIAGHTNTYQAGYTTAVLVSNIAVTASNKAFDISNNTNVYQLAYNTAVTSSNKAFDVANNTNVYQLGYNIAVTASNKAFDIANNTNMYSTGYSVALLASNIATVASNTAFDIAGNTNTYQLGYLTAVTASNTAVAASNKTFDIAGNTNTYQTGYTVAVLASNIAVTASNKAFAIAGNTNVYQAGYTTSVLASNIAITASNKAFDIAGNTNVYQIGYTIAVLASNIAVTASNKAFDIAGNTNTYQFGYITAVLASNIAVTASNKAFDIAGNTNVYQAGYAASVLASNIAVTASNKAFDIAGNTNAYQQTVVWSQSNSNGLNYTLTRTGVWDTAAVVLPRFKAGLQTNITVGGNVLAKVFMPNLMYSAGGGTYSATNSRWTPGVTNRLILFHGGWDYNTYSANQIGTLMLYKNGTNYTDLAATRSPNNAFPWTVTWTYVDVSSNTNDFYELYINNVGGSSATTAGAFSNNWWSSHVEH